MIEQTAEQKAAELAEKVAISVFDSRNTLEGLNTFGRIPTIRLHAQIILRELNLAELVKCKERCEALENHTARQHEEDYKCAPDSVKEVMASYCEQTSILRAKQLKPTSAPEHSPENRTTDP